MGAVDRFQNEEEGDHHYGEYQERQTVEQERNEEASADVLRLWLDVSFHAGVDHVSPLSLWVQNDLTKQLAVLTKQV